MISMTEIIISGTSGVGKSLYADGLQSAAKSGNLTVVVSDHDLFSKHKGYLKDLAKVRNYHKSLGVDISIIVINDGQSRLKVEFGGFIPYSLARLLFPK